MDQHLPGIDGRKEILAEKRHQGERRHDKSQESGGKQLRTPESAREKFVVGVADLLEPMLESELETLQRISRRGGWTSAIIGSAVGQIRHRHQELAQLRTQVARKQEEPDKEKIY